jgi:DNA-binding XRE family transcriptional regulator
MATIVNGKLKALRERRGMSKSELARRADTTYQTILNIESHRYDPRARTLAKIARALEINVDDLIDLEESPEED